MALLPATSWPTFPGNSFLSTCSWAASLPLYRHFPPQEGPLVLPFQSGKLFPFFQRLAFLSAHMQEVSNSLLPRTDGNSCYLRDAWPCCCDLALCGGYFPFWSTLTSVTFLNTFMAPMNIDSIRYVVISQMMNVAWVTTGTQTDMPSNEGQAYSDRLGYCWKGCRSFSVDLWCGVGQMILHQGLLLLHSLKQLQVSGMGKAFGPTRVSNQWGIIGSALSTIQKALWDESELSSVRLYSFHLQQLQWLLPLSV